MTVFDMKKIIRYPVWINDGPFCDRYENESELFSWENDMTYLADVTYITTDGEGEMTIEIDGASCFTE